MGAVANSLLGLLRQVLRGRVAVPELPAAQQPVSHCGCPLPEGCWGSNGWHNYQATLYTMDQRERRKFAEERPGWDKAELRKAYGAWWRDLEISGQLDAEEIPLLWKPYLGRPFAYEPCPAYRAKVAQSLEDQTAKKTPKRRAYERPANASWPKGERRGKVADAGEDE